MNIEDLITSKKDQLDFDDVPGNSWEHIQRNWKKEKPSFSWWKVAAVVFISTSLGLLIHNVSLQNRVDELASLGDISSEYQEIENRYIQQISSLESSFDIEQAKMDEEYQWVFEELNMLEEVNKLYRNDIGNVDENLLVGTLIDHYEKKIRLLRKLEQEIKRKNKIDENEKDNTNSINI